MVIPNRFLTEEDWSVKYENYFSWTIDRVVSKAVPRENGCLEYGAGKLKHKYGLIYISLKNKVFRAPAHRALWMAVHRDFSLPSSVYVRHKCDNPCCVNIKHLEIGTSRDNMQDCISRDRRAKKYRPHTRVLKFTDEQIEAIRTAPGKLTHVAEKFGTTPGYVSKLRNGKAKKLV